jgi:hypothetical protein
VAVGSGSRIFFQGYNQDAVWRANSSEKMCLNRQKDPL